MFQAHQHQPFQLLEPLRSACIVLLMPTQASSHFGGAYSSLTRRSSHPSPPGALQPSSHSLLAAMRGYSASSFHKSRTSVSSILVDPNSKFRGLERLEHKQIQ